MEKIPAAQSEEYYIARIEELEKKIIDLSLLEDL
jgi:hypothetical protein